MFKVFCDMCGTPIDYEKDGVNLNFNHYGVVKFKTDWSAERNFCLSCANKTLQWVDTECKKIQEERKRIEMVGEDK